MDIDSVCGSNPDRFADDQLLNDLLAVDSHESREVGHYHHDVPGDDDDYHLLGQPSVFLDQELLCLKNSNSSDCWSAATAASLDYATDPYTFEAASLTGDQLNMTNHDHVQEFHNPVCCQEIMENPIKQLSSCDQVHLLPPESDGEDVMSLESEEDEVQSESTVDFQVPEIGMKFSCEDEAYKFYSTYAKKVGFRVRKGKVTRLSDGTIRTKFFFCSRQGFKCKKDSTKTASKYHRKETRIGCLAMVKLTFENGKCEISKFVPEHNHDLEGKSKLIVGSSIDALQDHSMSTTLNKARIEAVTDAEEEAVNSVEICEKYCTNFLYDDKTSCIQAVDGQSLMDCFRHIQLENPSFLYTVQVNDKNCLMHFFWTDGRSKIDYDCFGDVLIVDTMLLDAYNMIFATFFGLNHHRKCVLFGGGLLLDSSIASFDWLFKTFMEVMGGRQPKTIFTDRCQAMDKAIEIVLPETQHLLGTWYILQNATKHLPKYHGQLGFDSLFKKCIFNCESDEELDSMWESLLEQYELRDDLWLRSLYVLRTKWSHFCCKSIFSAGLRTIQGSESINKFLYSYLTSDIKGSTASDLVLHYLKIAEQQRKEELDEDFRDNKGAPAMVLRGNAMEKQAAKVYSGTMFRLFQEELLGCLSLEMEESLSDGVNTTFKLTEESGTKDVHFNSLESYVTCSCKKYESVGILCVHALKVLNAKNIFRMPAQYILKRWRKHAKDGVLVDEHECEGEVADESMRHVHLLKSRLTRKATNVITKSLAVDDDQQTWMIVDDYLNMALKRVEEVSRMKNGTGCHSTGAAASANFSRINQKEVSNGTVTSQLKRKCENEAANVAVRLIRSKSSDGAITQHHSLKEGTKGGDQVSRRAVSHSNCMGEISQQSVFRSSRPPLPSQSTFLQVRDHNKSSECWKEPATRGRGTGKRMIMEMRMEEMEKEILKLRNEHLKIVSSLKSKSHQPVIKQTSKR